MLTQMSTPSQTPIDVFCKLTASQYTQFFVKPAGNKGDFSHLQEIFCRTRPDQLLDDLRMLPAGKTVYYDNIVSMNSG